MIDSLETPQAAMAPIGVRDFAVVLSVGHDRIELPPVFNAW
jgi:hypothetical protein